MFLKLLCIFICVTFACSGKIGSKQDFKGYTCYECIASQCYDPLNKTCSPALGCFTSIKFYEEKYLLMQRGCFVNRFVKLALCQLSNVSTEIYNCCDGNFCNDGKFPSTPDNWIPVPETEKEPLKTENCQLNKEEINLTHVSPFYYVPPIIVIVFATSFICGFFVKEIVSNKRRYLRKCYLNPTCEGSFDDVMSIGSRSSLPTLNQRCMAQDVTLLKCIGQGRYGEVWQGRLYNENVAVKIFSSKDEASWQNEVNIYTNIALYHGNVLGFKGSVITTRSCVTEMWLLTAFHPRGSLYDYLVESTITHKEMIEFVYSISAGLLHLHTEMLGLAGKPAIAHRDLKSRNILLTSHGTCVIADFGLAVVKREDTASNGELINYLVGTKRYMAPEILDDSIKINSFESFKRTDIYAYGLVLWEICSRCITNGTAEAYRPPFDDWVPNNPDFEDMKKVVCIELKRPEIPDSWSSDKLLNDMATLMKRCWHENPEIRPTVYRVMNSLEKMPAVMHEPKFAAKLM